MMKRLTPVTDHSWTSGNLTIIDYKEIYKILKIKRWAAIWNTVLGDKIHITADTRQELWRALKPYGMDPYILPIKK